MDSLSHLTNALRCLPGVGPKSAQRMAYHLLNKRRDQGRHLAFCLEKAMTSIRHCSQCQNFTDETLCRVCADLSREQNILCVVETPSDILAIEQSLAYKGQYFVLMGKISPIDGLGPDEIGLPKLYDRIKNGNFDEVVIALSPSIEGQTTIHFIQEQLKPFDIQVSQLAHGIPSGGELEFLDGNTIGTALRNRATI